MCASSPPEHRGHPDTSRVRDGATCRSKVASVTGLVLDICGVLILTAGALWNEDTIRHVGTYDWLEGKSYRHRLRVGRIIGWWAFGITALGFALQAIGSLLG